MLKLEPNSWILTALLSATRPSTGASPKLSYAVQQVFLFMHDPPQVHSRRSTSGYCIYFGDNLVSWSSKLHTTDSRSSVEAEYRAITHTVADRCWFRQRLQELHIPLSTAIAVYCNNVSVVYMTANPVHHKHTKHIEIDIHFVHEKVALGNMRDLHVPSSHQYTDIMTKGLPVQLFTDFRFSLCVRHPPARQRADIRHY
jgi:hypothetical protein